MRRSWPKCSMPRRTGSDKAWKVDGWRPAGVCDTVAFWEGNMRAFLGVIAVLISFTAAFAGPKEDALQIVDTWARAFAASDVDGIVKLYAPDALFVGTGSKTVVTKPEGIRKYFEAALLTNRPRGATLNSYEAVQLSGSAVVVAGLDTVTGVRDGNPTSATGRVTFVV